MAKRIRDVGARHRSIRDTGERFRSVSKAEVAKALGSDAPVDVENVGQPFLLQIHEDLAQRLVSSGGRPGLAGASKRYKIPLTDNDWLELKRIATTLMAAGRATSPGQVASVLVHRALGDWTKVETESDHDAQMKALAHQLVVLTNLRARARNVCDADRWQLLPSRGIFGDEHDGLRMRQQVGDSFDDALLAEIRTTLERRAELARRITKDSEEQLTAIGDA